MPQNRLKPTLYSLLLSLVAAPSYAAIFNGGNTDSGPTPPPPAVFSPAGQTDDAPRRGSRTPKAPPPTPYIPVPGDEKQASKAPEGLTQEQFDKLNAAAKQLADDPAKLKELLKSVQEQGMKEKESTARSTSGGDDELTAVEDEIARIRSATADVGTQDQAFKLLLEKALPMSPDQIKLLRRLYDLTQQAVATPPNAPPTPRSTSSVISLDPGNTPPVVRTSAGFVSSIVFTDSTGAPWPIVSYTLGDPKLFNIQWDQKSNTLFLQSLKTYAHGNLAVKLFENPTPVMISMVSGQKEVDFRIDFQIAGRGPEATAPIMTESLSDSKINPILINILDGIPPKGSTKLRVSGNHGDAWISGESLYFRSKLTVLSPAWTATVSSPDGTHVYEMIHTPSILASKDGQTIEITLTGL